MQSETLNLQDEIRPAPPARVVQPTPRAPAAVTPMQMLQIAVERGADLAMLEKLMDLQQRWEEGEARKAFVAALSAFKAEPPTIIKNKHVGFATRDGDRTEYDHATLDQVCNAIAPALSKQGLSHRWTIDQDNAQIRVTCVLTHVLGHSEKVALSGIADASGKKNPIQQVASTVTYLQRYTLLAITGLAASNDDDAKGAGGDLISAEQKEELIRLMQETGADTKRFLGYLRIETLDDLPADEFEDARAALAKKGKKQ